MLVTTAARRTPIDREQSRRLEADCVRTRAEAERQAEIRRHVSRACGVLRRSLQRVSARQTDQLQAATQGVLPAVTTRSGAASLEERFVQRISFGWNVALHRQVAERGWRWVLDQQLEPESIDDGGLEAVLLEALPTLDLSPIERLSAYQEMREIPVIELALAVFVRAIYSPRQLFERTVELWSDHLHTSIEADLGPFVKADYDADLRGAALSSFRDLLRASARSPAMLDYLTNNTNVKSAPNENYARELMELHTLGVDGGFSQHDVREVARAFTGWNFYDDRDPYATFGRFRFLARDHDTGPKNVLGLSLPAGGGVEDGEQVLAFLAAHSSTARFVAEKIVVHFWGERPPVATLDRVAETFYLSGGDVRATLRRLLTWHELAIAPPKLKRPLHFVVSALRALFADVEDAGASLFWLFTAGHFPFYWGPPNGYPDRESYWSGAPLQRWNFATGILAGDPGLRLDLPPLADAPDARALVSLLDGLLLAGQMSGTTRSALLDFLGERPLDTATRREAIGLAVAAPEFQYY